MHMLMSRFKLGSLRGAYNDFPNAVSTPKTKVTGTKTKCQGAVPEDVIGGKENGSKVVVVCYCLEDRIKEAKGHV